MLTLLSQPAGWLPLNTICFTFLDVRMHHLRFACLQEWTILGGILCYRNSEGAIRIHYAVIAIHLGHWEDVGRKVKVFGQAKWSHGYLQTYLGSLLLIPLLADVEGNRRAREYSFDFEVSRDREGVEWAICLSLEGFDEAIEINDEIVPASLLIATACGLYEEGLDLCLGGCRWKHDSPFGLHGFRCTLVRSLTTSSMLQEKPWWK